MKNKNIDGAICVRFVRVCLNHTQVMLCVYEY